MTPEILSRLTASGIEPSRIHYSGGVPEHTFGEIAGCLAGCSLGAQYYAAVYYRGADEYKPRLMNEIRLELAEKWERRGWEIPMPGILQGLAWLAIVEEDPANNRCPKCNGAKGLEIKERVCVRCYGTGSIRRQQCTECQGTGKQTITCALCNGSGIRWADDETRASIVQKGIEIEARDKANIPVLVWGRDINWKYESTVWPILSDYNSEIRSALAGQFEVDGDF